MFFKLNIFNTFLVVLNAFVLNYAEKKTSIFAFSSEQQIFHILTHFQFFVRIEREIVRPRDCDQNSEWARLQSSVGSLHCLTNPKKVRSFALRQSRYKKSKTRTRSIVQHTSASRKRECQKNRFSKVRFNP